MEVGIGIAGVVIGIILSYFTFMRNRDKDVESRAAQQAEVSMQLSHISLGVNDIKLDLKHNESQISDIKQQLVRVDESVRTAHKRIDSITKGVSK